MIPWIALLLALQEDPPKAARSVHLRYDAPEGTLFHNEIVVEESARGTYFAACGWNTGYFGIQELASGEKIALFSGGSALPAGRPARGGGPAVTRLTAGSPGTGRPAPARP